ncbi:MAG: hypothetical protein JSS79_10360 [Bacteroidetes bacterium]|nr:hypothetical protein [Bacteroidota bacterium]
MYYKKLIIYGFAFCVAGFFLFRCVSKSEKPAQVFDRRAAEADYLTKRSEYNSKLYRRIDKADGDSLSRAEEQFRLGLEEALSLALKESHFSGEGSITIETLFPGIGNDMLDGLVLKKDSSTRIFHTTTNLFNEYFRGKDGKDFSGGLSSDHFEIIFMYAFQSEARVNNYSFFKLSAPDSIKAYGMLAQLGQGDSSFPPQYIYVFVAMKNFIYMAEIDLKTPVAEIPKCRLLFDSLFHLPNQSPTNSDSSSSSVDFDPYKNYYKCYIGEFKHHPQFPKIKQKMQSIADYLINPNSK